MTRYALLVLTAMVSLPLSVVADLGATVDQCTARYGGVTFTRREGQLEYRSFHVDNKEVRVLFDSGTSAIEQITRRAQDIQSTESLNSAAQSAMLSLQILLSTTYGFTDKQLAQLTHTVRTAPDELASASSNGTVVVACTTKLNEPEHEFTFMAMIALESRLTDGERLQNFFRTSMTEELSRGDK